MTWLNQHFYETKRSKFHHEFRNRVSNSAEQLMKHLATRNPSEQWTNKTQVAWVVGSSGVYYQVSDHNESHEKMDASGFQPVLYGMEGQSLKTHCSLARWYLLNLLICFTQYLLDFFQVRDRSNSISRPPCLRRLGTPFWRPDWDPRFVCFPNFSNGRV